MKGRMADVNTANLGTILTGISALLTAILGYIKFSKGIKDTEIFKASKGNAEIQDIINNICKIENAKLVSVAEITNGGGIPEVGKPLYIRNIFCTDNDTLRLFEEKYLLEGVLISVLSRVIYSGHSSFTIADTNDEKVKSWFITKKVERSHHFLIGIDKGKRVLVLIVNLSTTERISDVSYFEIISAANKIKKLVESQSFFRKLIS